MRLISCAILVALFASCATYTNRKSAVNVFGGIRSLENEDFDDVDDSDVYGAELLIGVTKTGLGIEGGYARAEADGDGDLFGGFGNAEVDTDELYVGVRNTWNTDGNAQPYVAAGASWMDANASSSSGFDDDDSSAAAYVRGGIGWQFEGGFQVGLDARAMIGSDFEVEDDDTDLDYFQALVFLGWSW